MVKLPISWDRYWYPAGTILPDGFLPHSEHESNEQLGFRLSELDGIPCLILLGVPGMGKTSELERASALARTRGEQTAFVSLGRLNATSDLSSLLLKDIDVNKPVTVFFDGLDEALSQLFQIEQLIMNFLREFAEKAGGLTKLHLRISCRSAEWSTSLEAELRTLWGEQGLKLFELANLKEADVTKAAKATLPEPETVRFLKLIEDFDAESLASRPITLNMLLNVFEQKHS